MTAEKRTEIERHVAELEQQLQQLEYLDAESVDPQLAAQRQAGRRAAASALAVARAVLDGRPFRIGDRVLAPTRSQPPREGVVISEGHDRFVGWVYVVQFPSGATARLTAHELRRPPKPAAER